MTLALELGGIHDPVIRRNFETISQQFPVPTTGGGGGGGAPSGPAGGDLAGTYPNPGIAALVIVDGDISATAAIAESKLNLATDAAAGTGSRRTLGTGALQAAAGNDARFSDARTPTAHHTTHEPGGSDPMAVDAAAATGSLRTIGTGALQAAAGNDSRLTNARTPTAHATTHQPGGSDPMAVDAVAATGSLRTLGTGATQAAAGNDSRLSDARTPTAHQSTHQSGNSDALTGNLDAVGRSNISKAGTLVAARRGLNLIEGTGVTMTVVDNSGSERVDVTINSSGGGSGTVALDSWHTVGGGGEPAFQNSWVSFDGGTTFEVPAFRKFEDGRVQLRGSAKGGAVNTVIFTLPVGYRPPKTLRFAPMGSAAASTAWGQVNIAADGTVTGWGDATTTLLSLDGVIFDTGSVSSLVFGGSSFVSQAKWFTD